MDDPKKNTYTDDQQTDMPQETNEIGEKGGEATPEDVDFEEMEEETIATE